MNSLDRQYQELLNYLLHFSSKKKTRNGEVFSTFGWQIRHHMKEGFPLLTTKKMAWKQIVTELMWFLRGDTNIKYLVDNDCHIWDGDAYASYVKTVTKKTTTDTKQYQGDCDYELVAGTVLEDIGSKYDYYSVPFTKERFIERIKSDDKFAKKWGELGPIYGKQWRKWQTSEGYNSDAKWMDMVEVDQIQNLINELKTNPDSRRLIVSAWNVGELEQMVLPPCHYGFQVYTRELSIKERIELWEKIPNRNIMDFPTGQVLEEQYHDALDKLGIAKRAISLMWNQRSVDTFLGLPFNIASYGLLLEILAKNLNMLPETLIGNLGDTHLYCNHQEQAEEQLTRKPFPLPRLNYESEINVQGFYLDPKFFKLDGYKSHPSIKAPLSN